jgi:hypothetical protein
MLGELAGPSNFAIPLLFIVVVVLALLVFFSKVKDWRQGAISGFVFGIPIAVICFVIPSFDPAHLNEHVGQLRFVAVSTVVLSVIVLGIRASTRRLSPPRKP